MGYIILISALIITLIFAIKMAMNFQYNKFMVGTIVGKYRGTSKDGFIIVETKYKIKVETPYQTVKNTSTSETFEVPLEYYNKCEIGDEVVFPFLINGELV